MVTRLTTNGLAAGMEPLGLWWRKARTTRMMRGSGPVGTGLWNITQKGKRRFLCTVLLLFFVLRHGQHPVGVYTYTNGCYIGLVYQCAWPWDCLREEVCTLCTVTR